MEKAVSFLLPLLLGVVGCRMVAAPLRWGFRLAMHAGCGLLCLWLLNLGAGITGLAIPVNGVTVALAGFFGLPGIGLVVLLALL